MKYRDSHLCVSSQHHDLTHPLLHHIKIPSIPHRISSTDHKLLEGPCTVKKGKQNCFIDVLKWKDCRTETHEIKLAMSQFLFSLSSFCFLKLPSWISTMTGVTITREFILIKGGNWSAYPKKTLAPGPSRGGTHGQLVIKGIDDQLANLTLKE